MNTSPEASHGIERRQPPDIDQAIRILNQLTDMVQAGLLPQADVDRLVDAADAFLDAVTNTDGSRPESESDPVKIDMLRIKAFMEDGRTYTFTTLKVYLFGTIDTDKDTHNYLVSLLRQMVKDREISSYNGRYMTNVTRTAAVRAERELGRRRSAGDEQRQNQQRAMANKALRQPPEDHLNGAHLGTPAPRSSTPNKPPKRHR